MGEELVDARYDRVGRVWVRGRREYGVSSTRRQVGRLCVSDARKARPVLELESAATGWFRREMRKLATASMAVDLSRCRELSLAKQPVEEARHGRRTTGGLEILPFRGSLAARAALDCAQGFRKDCKRQGQQSGGPVTGVTYGSQRAPACISLHQPATRPAIAPQFLADLAFNLTSINTVRIIDHRHSACTNLFSMSLLPLQMFLPVMLLDVDTLLLW